MNTKISKKCITSAQVYTSVLRAGVGNVLQVDAGGTAIPVTITQDMADLAVQIWRDAYEPATEIERFAMDAIWADSAP